MSSSTQYCSLCSSIQTGIYGFQYPAPRCLRMTKMCVKPYMAHTATCAFISAVFKQPGERDILLPFKQQSRRLNLTNWYPSLPHCHLIPAMNKLFHTLHVYMSYSGCWRGWVYPTEKRFSTLDKKSSFVLSSYTQVQPKLRAAILCSFLCVLHDTHLYVYAHMLK